MPPGPATLLSAQGRVIDAPGYPTPPTLSPMPPPLDIGLVEGAGVTVSRFPAIPPWVLLALGAAVLVYLLSDRGGHR